MKITAPWHLLLLAASCGWAAGSHPAPAIVRCHSLNIVVDDVPDEDYMYGECGAADGTVFRLLNSLDKNVPGSSPLLEVEVYDAGRASKHAELAAYLRVAYPSSVQYVVLRTLESEPRPVDHPVRLRRDGAASATVNVLTLVLVYDDATGENNTATNTACDEACWAEQTFSAGDYSVHSAFQDGSYGRISFDRATSKRKLVAMQGTVASRVGCDPAAERDAALARSGENQDDYNLIECTRRCADALSPPLAAPVPLPAPSRREKDSLRSASCPAAL